MYPYIELISSMISIASIASVVSAYFAPRPTNAMRLLAKWPYAVLIFETALLTPGSSPELNLVIAVTVALIYSIIASTTNSRFLEHARLWQSIGFILPFLTLLVLNQTPELAAFYFQTTIISTVMTFLLIVMIIRNYLVKKQVDLLAYNLLLLVFTIILRFNLDDQQLIASHICLLLIEVISTISLIRVAKKDLSLLTEQHKKFETQFEKQVELEVKKRTFYMELTKERMAEINKTDHLTKLLNRKTFITHVNELISNKQVNMFTLFIFDIDYFKQINDQLGHTTGDICLKNLAGILKSQLTENQLAGRFGGDEFVVLLPNKNFKDGLAFARQLMDEIDKQTAPAFSISMGMAVYPWDGETYKGLFDIADKGLYFAKEKGRKRLGYKGYIKPQPEDLDIQEL